MALLSEQNQQQNQEGETEANSHKKSSSDLISMMLSAFLQLIHDDKLASMLSIRKGKVSELRTKYCAVREKKQENLKRREGETGRNKETYMSIVRILLFITDAVIEVLAILECNGTS